MQSQPKSRFAFLNPQIGTYFIAGGCAGAVSRTVVSPLERLKIIQQVQSGSSAQYSGIFRSLVRMWKEEGIKGYMRGNGINCLRIFPYSAVQFTTYEQLKKFFTNYGTRPLDTPTRLCAGALAGITSVCSTYPLDLVRARLSIASASLDFKAASPDLSLAVASPVSSGAYRAPKIPGIWGMTLKVMRDEGGVRALYRGLVPTAVGVAPYVGINFASYELFRGIITPPDNPATQGSVPRKLLCGALSGSISQTLTYPFDVIRRKMQVTAMGAGALGYKYDGAIDALKHIFRNEGIPGLYRGLWPNLLKVAPSIAVSFFTYETIKEFILTY